MEYVQTHITNKQGVWVSVNQVATYISWWIRIIHSGLEKMEIKFFLNFTQGGWVDGPGRALKWQILGLGTQPGSETALLTFSPQRTPFSYFRGSYFCLTSRSIQTILLAQQYFWWAISADEYCRHLYRCCFHFLLKLWNGNGRVYQSTLHVNAASICS